MFILNKNTKIKTEITTTPIQNAIDILTRDRDKVFITSEYPQNQIVLKMTDVSRNTHIPAEGYEITITQDTITITAQDDLGFIYGLLYISETYMGIKPFWFWMDQQIITKEKQEIEETKEPITSPIPVVRFRGWFFNDEVLMLKWKYNEQDKKGWKMALEALLRCGGNMAIPGTDKMSRENRKLATDMGLWLTHHHAEPLGAEMFVRAYPDKKANFQEHEELFYKLWEDAVIEQKDAKVVWNLCFRGQGDTPFWSSDTTGAYNTPEKRGALISSLIRKQREIVRKHVENPIFCTNLYGEIMELYEQGYIELDADVIKVRADNGYGKMVTRRRDNHSPRVASMPHKNDTGMQGIYYHVSFYDLQAANHITMLQNSVSFVNEELRQVLANGGKDFWVINCSNVRPHTYHLDAIRKIWFGQQTDDVTHSQEFADAYYHGNKQIAECYRTYPEAMISYGTHEDEHMGEQFYTENLRILAHQFIVDRNQGAKALRWIVGEGTLAEQTKKLSDLCKNEIEEIEQYYEACKKVAEQINDNTGYDMTQGSSNNDKTVFVHTLLLHATIHAKCARAVVTFGEAYEAYEAGNIETCFVLLGDCATILDEVQHKLQEAEYGVWETFYYNDCFADIKHTAYMVRKMMGVVREFGDNARHDKWYRKYCYAKADRDVFLLLVLDNHMTDEELYQVMKENRTIDF